MSSPADVTELASAAGAHTREITGRFGTYQVNTVDGVVHRAYLAGRMKWRRVGTLPLVLLEEMPTDSLYRQCVLVDLGDVTDVTSLPEDL